MSEKQTNAVLAATQSERLPLIIEWGVSPLLIFASALGVGGFTVFGTDIPIILLGTFSILLGALGGCIVGFLPYIARRWQISRAGWWAWMFVISALIVIDFILIWHFLNTGFVGCDTCPLVSGIPVLGIYIMGVSVTFGAIMSMVVALITRGVYRHRWTWTVAGILIIVSMFINLRIMAMMFAQ